RHGQGGRPRHRAERALPPREDGRQVGCVATEEGMKTALVHSEEWRRFDYGPEHPLRMERLGLTLRLMEAYGLTSGPRAQRPPPRPPRGHPPFPPPRLSRCPARGQRGRLGTPRRALRPGGGRQSDLSRALGGG